MLNNTYQQYKSDRQQVVVKRLRFIYFAVLICMIAVAMPVLAGTTAAGEVETVDRSVDEQEIGAGESVNVTVDIVLDEPGDPALFENITPNAEDIKIQSIDPQTVTEGVYEDDGEVIAVWEDTTQAEIVYTVTAQSDAEDQTVYSINGHIDTMASDTEISGDTEIVVNRSTLAVDIDSEVSDTDIEENENANITVELTNTGAGFVSQDIDILVAGDQEAALDNISLTGGTSTTEVVTLEVDDSFDGEELQVSSEDDSDVVELTVESDDGTDDDDDTDDEEDDGIPGFTIVAAVVAMIIGGIYVRMSR